MNALANILSRGQANRLNMLAGEAYYRLSVARALTMQKDADRLRALNGLNALGVLDRGTCPSTGTLIGITLLGYLLLLGVPYLAYRAGKFGGRKLFAK
jgi:hypothetical protein